MKGLILKDFYMIKKYLKFYLLMVVCFSTAYAFGAENVFFTMYPSVLSGVLITTLLSYDESFHFLEYADGLPITRKTFVKAKYALALIIVGIMGVINTVATTMNLMIKDTFSFAELTMTVSLLILMNILGFAITLPLTFKYGNEKGRIIYILTLGGLSAVFMSISYGKNFVPQNAPSMSPTLLITSALIFLLSMYLSVRFYEKREL